jgi:hypothetical protein
LVHHFGVAFLQGDKSELVPLRHLDGFGEAEFIYPKGQNGLDFLNEQNRGNAFDEHSFLFLRVICLPKTERSEQDEHGGAKVEAGRIG